MTLTKAFFLQNTFLENIMLEFYFEIEIECKHIFYFMQFVISEHRDSKRAYSWFFGPKYIVWELCF